MLGNRRERGQNSWTSLNMKDKSTKIEIGNAQGSYVNGKPIEPEIVKLFCIDLTEISRTLQFVICTIGVFFFYLIYGYFQELIFRLEGFRPYGWYLTLIQFACYTVFGTVELRLSKDRERRVPLPTYSVIAFFTVATMGLSNTSVGYLNYPTQVIFKCCKLIPVLIGGILIQGIILISLALCADAVIGNVQEKAMKEHNSTNSEMVLYSYAIGFLYILIGLVISGQLVPAFMFCTEYPIQTYGYAVIFSLTGYVGVTVVLTMVKTFGALIAVTVTTCRKAVTIILSFIFFTKPFTSQYIWAGVIVVFGIYLNIYSKNRQRWDPAFKALWYKLFEPGRKKIIQLDTLENIV